MPDQDLTDPTGSANDTHHPVTIPAGGAVEKPARPATIPSEVDAASAPGPQPEAPGTPSEPTDMRPEWARPKVRYCILCSSEMPNALPGQRICTTCLPAGSKRLSTGVEDTAVRNDRPIETIDQVPVEQRPTPKTVETRDVDPAPVAEAAPEAVIETVDAADAINDEFVESFPVAAPVKSDPVQREVTPKPVKEPKAPKQPRVKTPKPPKAEKAPKPVKEPKPAKAVGAAGRSSRSTALIVTAALLIVGLLIAVVVLATSGSSEPEVAPVEQSAPVDPAIAELEPASWEAEVLRLTGETRDYNQLLESVMFSDKIVPADIPLELEAARTDATDALARWYEISASEIWLEIQAETSTLDIPDPTAMSAINDDLRTWYALQSQVADIVSDCAGEVSGEKCLSADAETSQLVDDWLAAAAKALAA